MKTLGIIPARYASTRFPGKPLANIRGKSMIRRVLEQTSLATSLDRVVVATDDSRIAHEVREAGGEVIMTSSTHQSGTERVAEAARKAGNEYGIIINIQGDEPFICPEQINELCSLFTRPEVVIGTLMKAITDEEEIFNPNKPKVVTDNHYRALYFSRAPLPFVRKGTLETSITHFKHLGLYGYNAEVLQELVKLPPGRLEMAESLEQLRWLEHGIPIHCAETAYESWAIDVPADIENLPEDLE